MEDPLFTLIEEALAALAQAIAAHRFEPQKLIGEAEGLAGLVMDPDPYPELAQDPKVCQHLGYLQGLADALGLTVLELLDHHWASRPRREG